MLPLAPVEMCFAVSAVHVVASSVLGDLGAALWTSLGQALHALGFHQLIESFVRLGILCFPLFELASLFGLFFQLLLSVKASHPFVSGPHLSIVGAALQAKAVLARWTIEWRPLGTPARVKRENVVAAFGGTASSVTALVYDFGFEAASAGLFGVSLPGQTIVPKNVLNVAKRERLLALVLRTKNLERRSGGSSLHFVLNQTCQTIRTKTVLAKEGVQIEAQGLAQARTRSQSPQASNQLTNRPRSIP